MPATVKEGVLQTCEIIQEEEIAAPIEIVFETILEPMGRLNSTPEKPMPMVLEAWPGERWHRDLGNNTGHFWVRCRPSSHHRRSKFRGLSLCRIPPFRTSNIALTEENGVTRMRFVHRAMGWVGEQERAWTKAWNQLTASERAER